MTLSTLPEFIITSADADHFQDELTLIQASLFETNTGSTEQVLNNNVRDWVAEWIQTNWKDVPHQDRGEWLKQLNDLIDQVTKITLTLAFEPSRAQLQRFQNWLNQELKQPVLLEIKFQPNLIGGATIVINGQYLDFSLQKKMNQVVEAKLKTLLPQLHQVK